MKKVLSFIVVFALAFVLAGCSSSGIDKATDRLEAAGYVVEVLSGDDLAELGDEFDEANLKDIYSVSTTVEGVELSVAIIYEFESESALEDEILEPGETLDGMEDYVYQNLFVLDLGLYLTGEEIMPIIKGE